MIFMTFRKQAVSIAQKDYFGDYSTFTNSLIFVNYLAVIAQLKVAVRVLKINLTLVGFSSKVIV